MKIEKRRRLLIIIPNFEENLLKIEKGEVGDNKQHSPQDKVHSSLKSGVGSTA